MSNLKAFAFLFTITFLSGVCTCVAQDENTTTDADVTTEVVSDEFQEKFFEALREKAIENYDKAIGYLLECEKIEPDNPIIAYELGLLYTYSKSYEKAEHYLLKATHANPDNFWFLNALYDVYEKQYNIPEAILIAEKMAPKGEEYKHNLVKLYARNQQFKKAIQTLDELDLEYGKTTESAILRKQYETFLEPNVNNDVVEEEEQEEEKNPLILLQEELDELLSEEQYEKAIQKSSEALENYPTQSYFYYVNGKALFATGKHTNAIQELSNALDFLVDDVVLEKEIYNTLAECYKALGQTEKEKTYRSKAAKL